MAQLVTYDIYPDEHFRKVFRIKFRQKEESLEYAITNSLFVSNFEREADCTLESSVGKKLEEKLVAPSPEGIGEYGYRKTRASITYFEDDEIIPSGLLSFENAMFIGDDFDIREFEEDLLKYVENYWTHDFIFNVLRSSIYYFNEIKKQVKKINPKYTETSWDEMRTNKVFHEFIKPKDFDYLLPSMFKYLYNKSTDPEVWFDGSFMDIKTFNKIFNDAGYLISGDIKSLVATFNKDILKLIDTRTKFGKALRAVINATGDVLTYQLSFYEGYVEMKPSMDKPINEGLLLEKLMASYFNVGDPTSQYIFKTSYAIAEQLLKYCLDVHYGTVATKLSFVSDGPINTYFRLPASAIDKYASNWVFKDALSAAGYHHSYNKEELVDKLVEMCVVEYKKNEDKIAALFENKLIKCAGVNATRFAEYLTFPQGTELDANTKSLLLVMFIHKHLRNNTVVDRTWDNTLMDVREIAEGLIAGDKFMKDVYFIKSVELDKIIGQNNVSKNS